ncbi:MAG: Crp/Fnr family transcriptional regulator [Sutterellaceae bacterium]|nr:Crp/Fnr family transcriptional regulator [Sutterellaceae bacterium]MDD7442358.1 Crp/Fnr family transcriptional regulator [Sutterellaceae bacterium]
MRQIFQRLPWVHPAVPQPIAELYKKRGVLLEVRKNEILKAGGENPKSFLLVRGLCAYRINSVLKGSPSILSLIIPGRSMCDISAAADERVNVTTVAWQDSMVLAMPPGTLNEERARDPEFGRLLMEDVIAKQESHIEGMVANFTLDPQDRLRTLLKVLLTSYGIPVRDGAVVPLLLNNTQYGQIVNLTRVSVSRIFSKWEAEGLIRKDGRAISVRRALFDPVYDWLDGTGAAQSTRLSGYGRSAQSAA